MVSRSGAESAIPMKPLPEFTKKEEIRASDQTMHFITDAEHRGKTIGLAVSGARMPGFESNFDPCWVIT